MKKLPLIIGIVILAILGWLIISNTSNNNHQSMDTDNDSAAAPNFSLQDYSGKTVKLSDFAGKPIVINSWAAWCPFCRKELVDFVTAQKEFGDKVIIIAIDRAEVRDVAKKYTDELGVTGDMLFLLDPSDSFYQSIGGFSMPETVFVESSGNIVFHKRGPMDIKEMRERIQELLN